MRLKEARMSANLTQADVLPIIRKVEPRYDKALFSKMECGIVLPTPPQAATLCKVYHVAPDDLFTRKDVDFGLGRKADDLEPTEYKLTVRMPYSVIGSAEVFKTLLMDHGYLSPSAWVFACYKRLQLSQKAHKRKTAPAVTGSGARKKTLAR